MPLLTTVNLATNNLQGSVPSFRNSPRLVTINLSYNKFAGPVPAAWGALLRLDSLSASHNQLQSPISALVTCVLLTVCCASAQLSPSGYLFAVVRYVCWFVVELRRMVSGGCMCACVGQTVDLSYNNLTSDIGDPTFVLAPSSSV
jgi:hypothetical protein